MIRVNVVFLLFFFFFFLECVEMCIYGRNVVGSYLQNSNAPLVFLVDAGVGLHNRLVLHSLLLHWLPLKHFQTPPDQL